MTRQDPGALNYPQTYPPRAPLCTCGHLAEVHLVSETTKQRTNCSSWRDGRCRCKRYEAVSDD